VVGVEDNTGSINWHADTDFIDTARLNTLLYFIKHYKDFKWNAKEGLFVNASINAGEPSEEDILFTQMTEGNSDDTAMKAFIELTEKDPAKVKALCSEFTKAGLSTTYNIPTFPFRFLEQLTLLTQYYRKNDIDYKGTPSLKEDIKNLMKKMSFKERRLLEDKLINTLTLNNIAAFEYWSLIYQKNWDLTYSAGRILDKFYSKNWNKILADKVHLDAYLKKSALFDRIGIIGICNDYLIKFRGASPQVLAVLQHYNTTDADIAAQAREAINIQDRALKAYLPTAMDTTYYHVDGFEQKLKQILRRWRDTEEQNDTLINLLANISYRQIGTALKQIENISFKDSASVYSFLERDWGFFLIDNAADAEERKSFLTLYSKYTEQELYEHYLKEAGIDYMGQDNKPDFDKVYELLKYDIGEAFTGGGGGALENEVHALIKVLEFHFGGNRLGFSNKACASADMWACYPSAKARAWMKFLEDNKLLKKPHDEPLSFGTFKH
jgi:hypothetical protein